MLGNLGNRPLGPLTGAVLVTDSLAHFVLPVVGAEPDLSPSHIGVGLIAGCSSCKAH